MADTEENNTPSSGNNKAQKKKSPILLIVIILVLLLVVGGAAAFFVLGGKKDSGNVNKEKKTEVVDEAAKYEVYEFDPFVVNLSRASNFLRTTVLVEYDPSLLNGNGENGGAEKGEGGEASAKGAAKIFEKRNAMIRDAIIATLSYKTPDELLMQDGKEALKEELVDAINEALGVEESVVVSVYFKEFIMQ